MDWKQRALENLMSDISEFCWCAGWMMGNEYALWKIISNPEESRSYGQGYLSDQEVADLKAMADECGGWIRFDDEKGETVFVPMNEWLENYSNAMKQAART